MGRVFSFIAMILVLAGGMYIYSRQVKALSPTAANNPKATVNLVGVRMDLSNIANAEKRYMASEGHYGSLDDLISSQVISEVRHRGPYTYSVEVNGENFVVTATRGADADAGLPATMSINQDLQATN